MHQFSLSISSSKAHKIKGAAGRLRLRILLSVAWTVALLIAMDAGVNFIFRAPPDPARATSLQRYFEYGRSIEGKLRRYVGRSPDQDALIVRAGWLTDCGEPEVARPGALAFDTYGNSFVDNVARQLEEIDPKLAGQGFGGPAAPVNHSYACFMQRARLGLARAPIQILGVLASSIPRMLTVSGLTTSFEVPEPFTYPRYSLASDGSLMAHWPSIRSLADLHAALADSEKWRHFLGELATYDYYYDPELVRANIFDHSVIGRMVRRAWAQRSYRMRTAALRPHDKYSGAPEIAPVLVKLLINFADTARKAGESPIVILFEDQGFGTSLSAVVAPALRVHNIDFVATSAIASPTDSSNFIPDGHFVPEVNAKITQAVLKLLDRPR